MDKKFKDIIYIIRGQQVILDSDLAQLYGTKVKRNIERFHVSTHKRKIRFGEVANMLATVIKNETLYYGKSNLVK